VWVSTAPFAPADFPSKGPAWDGSTSLKTPIKINGTPGADVSYRIQPLENGVTYWVGVHAFDQNKEGPMSNVVSGKPRVTLTAAELAGDPGGSPCSTGPAPGAGWVGAALGALALGRRRRLRNAVLAVPVLLGSATAAAADDEDPWWKADQTDATANFELRYGVIFLEDQRLNDVYRNNPTNLLNAELGPQIYRFGEVDFGVGFFQELAYAVTPGDLLPSSDRTMLTWYPLYLDATVRAHVLDEQPIVPFARYGWDYVIWSERADNGSGGKDVLQGGKFGTHTGVGVNILLDLLQRPRASFLEARTGINDSWLTIEWRHQAVDGRSRPWSGPSSDDKLLRFSGSVVQAGLKLDW
jgi:MYXO-CTERM domain-containing protein